MILDETMFSKLFKTSRFFYTVFTVFVVREGEGLGVPNVARRTYRLNRLLFTDQRLGTHPSLNSPGSAVSFTPFPSQEGISKPVTFEIVLPVFGQD